jgi:hypothetical protein
MLQNRHDNPLQNQSRHSSLPNRHERSKQNQNPHPS